MSIFSREKYEQFLASKGTTVSNELKRVDTRVRKAGKAKKYFGDISLQKHTPSATITDILGTTDWALRRKARDL